jgi:ribosomal protein S18 acetylase RimI-like enzyme
MNRVKALLRWVFGDYELYKIYQRDLASCEQPQAARSQLADIENPVAIANSTDPEIRALHEYAGNEAHGFGAWVDGALACVCWFWTGERYRRRNFWPLQDDEAKLVQISTAVRFQGRGIGSELMRFALYRMRTAGFRRAYARIWHSNLPSIRLFEGAGWTCIAFVAVIHPLRSPRPVRFVWRRRTTK